MDELAAPCPEDSRGSASGLGSERSLIGRPAKPEADKQRSKSWRCTLEAPSEVQQSRLREAGMDRCTSKLHTVATLAEGRGCTSSLHVQRFAMDISSDAGTEFLRAFFVFSIPVRRGQLEQRITADARWTPASYAEWPEVARTFQESRDYTHQGARTPHAVQPPSAMPDASQPASVAWQHWKTLADALPLLSVQESPQGESTEQQEARLQLPALDPRAEVRQRGKQQLSGRPS